MISKGILSKIHVAKAQLGMTDEDYRAMLSRVAGVRSAKSLDNRKASRVLTELRRLGFTDSNQGRRPHNLETMPPMATKIEALLTDMKLPWAYADGLGRQMFGVERAAWLRQPDQLRAMLAALMVEQEKRQLMGRVYTLCGELGVSGPDYVEGMMELPSNWTRQRPTLKAVIHAMEGLLAAREAQA